LARPLVASPGSTPVISSPAEITSESIALMGLPFELGGVHA
jgi:hypothetical protein